MEPSDRQHITRLLAIAISLLICALFLISSIITIILYNRTSSAHNATVTRAMELATVTATATQEPTQVMTPTPVVVIITCYECARDGIEVNLWQSPQRLQGVGSVPHGTRAIVLETANYEGRLFYRVQINSLVGWLPEDFVTLPPGN